MDDRIEAFQRDLLEWAEDNLREYPWRDPARSLYEVFVAEFFLTQTPADNVVPVYQTFVERYPTLTALDGADEAAVAKTIEPIGFQNMRAEALTRIASDRDSLPRTVTELTELPRVGRYVASATLCFALGEPLPIVDRNVDRVYERVLGDSWPERDADQWRLARRVLPENVRQYNLALLDFGAAICRPEPNCDRCFATGYCRYYQNVVDG